MDPFRRTRCCGSGVMAFLKSVEKWGRRRVALLFPGLLPSETVPVPRSPSSILVIRTDSRLGNLVLLEPLLRDLTLTFPRARMDILASHVFSGVLRSQGYSVIDVHKKRQIRHPYEFLQLVKRLRSQEYDIAIDAAHPHSFSLSGAVTAFLSGAGCRLSTDAGGSADWYHHTVPEPPLDWHESRGLHSLGSVWDNWPQWSPPVFDGGGEPRDAVGIHVGASGGKKYPLDKMDELVGMLSRRYLLEIYWGTEEEGEIAHQLSGKHPAAVMPRFSVSNLAEKLSGLRVFVTADNGPMHLASALSVPVVALFRICNMNRFAPLSRDSMVLYAEEGTEPEMVAKEVERIAGRG
ncbi:MAG: hypothetical protein GF388_11075 [Candidatus Aegiribacteria sp.]|nr:hypothetical protein [Candidatus Aegiribacteria sp.]MBD3295541.1 hypothetical protein [Candidatus Fermentibacteria bacterium]